MTDQTDVIEELRALYSQYLAMTDLGDPRHIWTQGVYDRLVHGLINNAELLLSAASRVSAPDGQPDLTDDEKGTVFQLCHIGAGNSGDVNTTCNKAVDLIQRLLDHRCAASPSPVRSEGQAGVPADAGPCEVCGWQSRGEMIEYLDGQIQELLRENEALRSAPGGQEGWHEELDVLRGDIARKTLQRVLLWWDSLPISLRQDIEGSGFEPGCIAATRSALRLLPIKGPGNAN